MAVFCGCVTSCGIFAGSPSQSGHQETPTGEPKVAQPQHGSPLRGLSGEVATTNAKSTNHTPHGNHSRTQKNAPLKPAIRPAQEGRYSSLFNAYTADRRAESAQSIGNFGWPRQVLSQPVRHSRGGRSLAPITIPRQPTCQRLHCQSKKSPEVVSGLCRAYDNPRWKASWRPATSTRTRWKPPA